MLKSIKTFLFFCLITLLSVAPVFAKGIKILDAATATGAGSTFVFPEGKFRTIGPLGITVTGTFAGVTGAIQVANTVGGAAPVAADWVNVDGGSFTSTKAWSIFGVFTHIRVNISAYGSGSVTAVMNYE